MALFDWRSPALIEPGRYDPDFQHELELLHRCTVRHRWLGLGLLWAVVSPVSIWLMRDDIELMREHFTWSSLRYALVFNPVAAIGLVLCASFTMGVLLWQSRNILIGLSEHDVKRLEKQLLHIRQQGTSHPLWSRVCDERNLALYQSAKKPQP
ncbi:MAG: hypothetical protein AAFQ57_02520 [Cyanobacteria bacterium J06626_14]